MIKRFCSSCDREIPLDEIYFDVMITPKIGLPGSEEGDNFYDDYCKDCTSNGSALVKLMAERDEDMLSQKEEGEE